MKPVRITMRTPSRLHAFTLVELLTVIAIVGILVAILIPVIGKMRDAGRQTQGLSNLRQLATAALSYTTDNKGLLPACSWYENTTNPDLPEFGTYTQLLSPYILARDTSGGNMSRVLNVYRDPQARVPAPNALYEANYIHFSANVTLMPGAKGDPTTSSRRVSLNRITVGPSVALLFGDGIQDINDSTATPGSDKVDSALGSGGDPAQSFQAAGAAGTNQDVLSNKGYFAFRSAGNTKGKFVFVDGHVAVLAPTEIFRRNYRATTN
jgi:prepilin-type N-terminal cleavage/methylation domain-containing protein/prepilin-type processing-associated H-X9-DG protein